MIRPAEFSVYVGPVAVIEGHVCAALSRLLNLDKLRAEIRGQDADLDQALLAIRLAALKHGESAGSGTKPAPVAEPVSRSPQQQNSKTVSTPSAAAALGVTDRAVRRAITEKRLAATKDDGGRYRITEDELRRYAATR